MNIQQVIFFVLSSYALSSQNQRQQYYSQQYNNNAAAASSYYNNNAANNYNNNNNGQYPQQYYSARRSVAADEISSNRDDRQQALNNVSAYAAANPGATAIPDNVRSSIIASYLAARSAAISQRVGNASAFMATQTQIDTVSLAQAVSSVAATATGKAKKGLFNRFKATKTNAAGDAAITATATTGMGKGFKNFFKSIQQKIQKSSSTSIDSVAPTST